jgi:hypothetical protein
MSQAILACSANPAVRPNPQPFPNTGTRECRSAAERLLKEAAYVCHLTRHVRRSMTGTRGANASPGGW